MNKKINTALVGFGMSGEFFHAPFLDANPNFNLMKIVERHSEKSKQLYPYVKVVKSFSEVLVDKEIELVIINTPNHLHYEMTKQALLAGKNVVVEKPFTANSSEAEELIEISKQQKRILTVFQNRRWDGDFMTVRKIIEDKLLGKLVEFESHFDRFRNFIKPNTWKEEILPGTGLLHDIGPHLIDQVVCLFGKPDSIFADLRTERPGGRIIDCFEIILNYKNLKVTLKSNFLSKIPLPRFTLHGTEGSFIKNGLDPQEDNLKLYGFKNSDEWGRDPEELWGIIDTNDNGTLIKKKIATLRGDYPAFFQNLYEAIAEGKDLAVRPEEALITARIIDASLQSNNDKRVIEF